jgi:hypothetical protein
MFTERSINDSLRRIALSLDNEKFNDQEIEIIFHFMLGYLFERYNNIKKDSISIIQKIIFKNKGLFHYFLRILMSYKENKKSMN